MSEAPTIKNTVIGKLAKLDPRTVGRWRAGLPVRPSTAQRIARVVNVLEQVGFQVIKGSKE